MLSLPNLEPLLRETSHSDAILLRLYASLVLQWVLEPHSLVLLELHLPQVPALEPDLDAMEHLPQVLELEPREGRKRQTGLVVLK